MSLEPNWQFLAPNSMRGSLAIPPPRYCSRRPREREREIDVDMRPEKEKEAKLSEGISPKSAKVTNPLIKSRQLRDEMIFGKRTEKERGKLPSEAGKEEDVMWSCGWDVGSGKELMG